MASETKVGSYTGTGAAIEFQLGWVPDYVRIWNITDGDEVYEFFSNMTNGHALKVANHDTAQLSRITSNGISKLEPTDFTKKAGFSVGTAVSESGKTFGYLAVRNAEY